MDENCLVSIKLSSQHCAIENSRKSWENPTVIGKLVGIVRKTIYNNHRTKYRLVRKSGGGGGGGGVYKKPYISRTAQVREPCNSSKFRVKRHLSAGT